MLVTSSVKRRRSKDLLEELRRQFSLLEEGQQQLTQREAEIAQRERNLLYKEKELRRREESIRAMVKLEVNNILDEVESGLPTEVREEILTRAVENALGEFQQDISQKDHIERLLRLEEYARVFRSLFDEEGEDFPEDMEEWDETWEEEEEDDDDMLSEELERLMDEVEDEVAGANYQKRRQRANGVHLKDHKEIVDLSILDDPDYEVMAKFKTLLGEARKKYSQFVVMGLVWGEEQPKK